MRRSIAFLTLALVFGLAACDSASVDSLTNANPANTHEGEHTYPTSFRGITPSLESGNPGDEDRFCQAINPDYLAVKYNAGDGGFSVTKDGIVFSSEGGRYLSWSAPSNYFVHVVTVKGGPNYHQYDYAEKFGDDRWLVSPLNQGGNIADISNVIACYTKVDGVLQGCTLGYWKNHDGNGPQANAWPAPYSPDQPVSSVFFPSSYGALSLTQALELGGGSGVLGAQRTLLRQAVAALLSAAHPDVTYALTTTEVITMVNDALDPENTSRGIMLALAEVLDGYNNAGCPL